jgi:hypothetical protein
MIPCNQMMTHAIGRQNQSTPIAASLMAKKKSSTLMSEQVALLCIRAHTLNYPA